MGSRSGVPGMVQTLLERDAQKQTGCESRGSAKRQELPISAWQPNVVPGPGNLLCRSDPGPVITQE